MSVRLWSNGESQMADSRVRRIGFLAGDRRDDVVNMRGIYGFGGVVIRGYCGDNIGFIALIRAIIGLA